MGVHKAVVGLLSWHSRSLAVLYAICLVGVGVSLAAYSILIPQNLDIGTTVAARAWAYRASFAEVKRAREELGNGDVGFAERRLLRYLRRTEKVQRSQLRTHAVAEAYELLAEIYLSSERPGRAVEHLVALTNRLPLHYRAWLLRAEAERTAGDLAGASSSMDRAFRLSLVDTGVVESYLQILDEQADYERVLWVEDQYRRARRRAAPSVVAKVGVAENQLQNWVLDRVGIPIEHGRFFRGFETRGLSRGESASFSCPGDLFKEWPDRSDDLTIQLRFEHVEELRITKVRLRTKNGKEGDIPLGDGDVRYLHRPHSVNEYYAEFGLDIQGREVDSLEIFYSIPARELSDGAMAIIDKARANRSPLMNV